MIRRRDAGILDDQNIQIVVDGFPALLHRLSEAAVANRSVAAQKAQIAAVKAYDAKVRSLNALGSRISDEEARLQKQLG